MRMKIKEIKEGQYDSGASISRGDKIRSFTSIMVIGFLGFAIGNFGDIDHLFEGQVRTWGHDWHFPCVIFGIMGIAFISGQIFVVLNRIRKSREYAKEIS